MANRKLSALMALALVAVAMPLRGRAQHLHQLVRRQADAYPQLPALPVENQPPPPSFQQQQQQPGNVFKFFQDLGPQVERAKAISSLFSSPNSNVSSAGPSQQFNPMQLMSQFSELVRSTQERNAKTLESVVGSAGGAVDQASQQTSSAAKQAQGGIQTALAEMGAGLQRLAANNPNLLPDIKNLYQSVSQRLSSASNSVAQAAQSALPKNGAEQFAEQLAKAGQQ